MFITFRFFCSSISWGIFFFKFAVLSFEYKPDGFPSDWIKYLFLNRNYESNENNRMKKDKEVVWVYKFLYSSSRKSIPIHIFEP